MDTLTQILPFIALGALVVATLIVRGRPEERAGANNWERTATNCCASKQSDWG